MQNKTAVITGATSGIGAAYAKRFAQQGYDLIITGRRKEKIEAFAEQLSKEAKVNVDVVLAELSEKEGIQKVIEQVQGRTVEILVNNAGFGTNCLYQDCDLAVTEQMANVNVLAPMELVRSILPQMIQRHSGTVINVSSESAFLIMPKNAAYSGVKSFLKIFTEGLYLDLMGTGVKAMAVCPGFTHSDFHDKLGIDRSRQTDHGPIHWMSAEEVVDLSLNDLKKNKVVCVPGAKAKMLIHTLNLLPRKAYYRFVSSFTQKNLGNRKVKA